MASHLGSPFMISMEDRKNSLSTFEGDPVSADGSDGVIDVVLTLQGRVDMYHLKVHGNTAEPAEKKGTNLTLDHPNNLKSPFVMQFKTYFLANLKTSLTWFSSSGPMPSPGMSVTVCLPPYFAGGGCKAEPCCYCNLMQILKIKLQLVFQFSSKQKQ